ncbi:putative short chain dehydrogenase/reductase [Mycobacteroides abscessus subsp. abscessus]|nr:putative short chain dehydrogenase/reductase [Mycobacteroides abscessus subsp. abscessus]
MTAGVSVRTTSPDVFNGELAAATDDIEIGLLVCITDEDAGGPHGPCPARAPAPPSLLPRK